MEKDSCKYHVVVSDETGECYMIKLLGGHKARLAFSRLLTILTPIIAAGGSDLYRFTKQSEDYDKSLESEDKEFVEVPEFDVGALATLISDGVASEAYDELTYILLDDIYMGFKAGDSYKTSDVKLDLDKDLAGELDVQLVLLEESFKANLSRPLVKWLEKKGFSEIGSSLQSMMSALLSPTGTK